MDQGLRSEGLVASERKAPRRGSVYGMAEKLLWITLDSGVRKKSVHRILDARQITAVIPELCE